MKFKYTRIILLLISILTLTFSGCGKNNDIKSNTHKNEKALGEPNTPFDIQDIQSQAEVTTTYPVTTTAPATTKTEQPPVTTPPNTTDSLYLHKNAPEITDIELSRKPFKLGEIVNIKSNMLTYRIIKISKSDYEHKDYLKANNLNNVYDIEIEAFVKNNRSPLINIINIDLGTENNVIKGCPLINNSYRTTVSNDSVTTFHIIFGTTNELDGDYTLTLIGQNKIIMPNIIRFKFNSNEIKQ